MAARKLLLIFALLLAVLSVNATAGAAKPVITQDAVVWNLTKTTVVDAGQAIVMEEGVWTRGITLEAKAKSAGGNVVPEGTFRLVFDVFVPNRDMLTQRAGLWYVHGTWTIAKDNASPESKKARHSPDLVQGLISAELHSDPLSGEGWTALASLPMSTAAGRWGRGQGSLTFDGRLEGTLYLDLKLWPEMQGG